MSRDWVLWLVRCLWVGHRPKFSTYPNCIYCGKDATRDVTR